MSLEEIEVDYLSKHRSLQEGVLDPPRYRSSGLTMNSMDSQERCFDMAELPERKYTDFIKPIRKAVNDASE